MTNAKFKMAAVIAFISVSMVGCGTFRIVTDRQSVMGGDNAEITVKKNAVRFENGTVKGVSSKTGVTATAVIYKDEQGKDSTSYSDINMIELKRVEYVKPKDDFVQMNVSRMFHIFKPVYYLTYPFMIFYGIHVPVDWYSEKIVAYPAHDGQNDMFATQFLDGDDMEILLRVFNSGNIAMTDEFTVVDIIPDYLKFISADWTCSRVEKVGYDVSTKGTNQVLVFKVRPDKKGIKQGDLLTLRLKVKPDMKRLMDPVYVSQR